MHDVLALQQAADRGFAHRHRAQNKRPLRDRFVARYADAALERGAAAGGQWGRRGVQAAISLKVGPSYHAAARAVIPGHFPLDLAFHSRIGAIDRWATTGQVKPRIEPMIFRILRNIDRG